MITREALADKFTYTPSIDFPVGEGAASYCVYMMHLRSVLARELQGYELEVRLPRPTLARTPRRSPLGSNATFARALEAASPKPHHANAQTNHTLAHHLEAAFHQCSPIEPAIETLSRVHTRTVRGFQRAALHRPRSRHWRW